MNLSRDWFSVSMSIVSYIIWFILFLGVCEVCIVDTFSNRVSINIAFDLLLLKFGIPFLTLSIISIILSGNFGSFALFFLLSSFISFMISFMY